MIITTDEFAVHIKREAENWMSFVAYPIVRSAKDDKLFWYYDQSESPIIEEFDEKTCFSKFKGSYCWRGVWEGRLYFTDEEYWGSDLSDMHDLYYDHIVPYCEKHIKIWN